MLTLLNRTAWLEKKGWGVCVKKIKAEAGFSMKYKINRSLHFVILEFLFDFQTNVYFIEMFTFDTIIHWIVILQDGCSLELVD